MPYADLGIDVDAKRKEADIEQYTVALWLLNFISQIVLALLLAAWFTDKRSKVEGQGTYKVFPYMPNIITAVAIAIPISGILGISTRSPLFPRAMSQADVLAHPFDECREGQIPRCSAAGYLIPSTYIMNNVKILLGKSFNPVVGFFKSNQMVYKNNRKFAPSAKVEKFVQFVRICGRIIFR